MMLNCCLCGAEIGMFDLPEGTEAVAAYCKECVRKVPAVVDSILDRLREEERRAAGNEDAENC